MRARFINEIKRDIEGSGLSSIGIGKVAMCDKLVYDELYKMWRSNKKLFDWYALDESDGEKYLETYLIGVNFPKYNAGEEEHIIYDTSNNTKKMTISMSKKWGEELEEFGKMTTYKLLKTKSYGSYEFYIPDIIMSNRLEEFFALLKRVCENRAGIIR